MPRILRLLAFALAAAVTPAVAASAQANAATTTIKPVTATTMISARPDSGVQGNNWALDRFAREATVTFVREVAATNCPGTDTGHCYLWRARIFDNGVFTTIAGQLAPRTGSLDQSLAGLMQGGTGNEQFYSSWKTAKASLVPATENDHGQAATGRQTTTNWVEQFFGTSAVFNSTANPGGPNLGSDAGWTYTLNFLANSACPNDAYKWVDSAAGQWGSVAVDGNILTPNAADCT